MNYTVIWVGAPFTRIETSFETWDEVVQFVAGKLVIRIVDHHPMKARKLAKIERAISRRNLTRGE